ncbi:MAG: hypothetical protein ACLFPO_06070 [Spirochaetaceae bacterium]
MTLVARNILLRIGLLLVFALLLGFVAAAVFVLTRENAPALSGLDGGQSWLALSWTPNNAQLYWLLGGLLVQGLASFIGLWTMLRLFRKTTAPEMFFFSVFVFTLAVDLIKAGQLVILIEQYPPVYGAMLTRVVHFGHFLGIFCLLSSSLYLSGLEYQKTGIVLGLAALIALTLAYSLPVDLTRLFPNLMNPVGDQTTIQVVALLLNILVVLNVLYAVAAVQEPAYVVLLGALLLVIAGRELALYVASPAVYLSAVGALIVGIIVFTWRIRRLYLWR